MGRGRRHGRSRAWRWVLAGALALLLVSLAAAGEYLWLRSEFRSPGPATALSRITVETGASLRSVLAQLQSRGAVADAHAVEWYLRLHNLNPRVQAGLYEIPARASPEQIIALFEQGKVVLDQLTVVEGDTFADLLEALEKHPGVQHTLQGKSPEEVMTALGHEGQAPEGEFFPDTYRFAANTPDTVILELAYDKMQRLLNGAWEDRAEGLPLHRPYQALILASMIEKEAERKSERARIAGVFTQRLHKGMRLQSDPTVIYGMGAKYDGTVHTRDLLRDTPYNTYTREGLPPTPIALPGRDSLMAALHPEEKGELYFVATGLGDGAHHFSKTLGEHNSAVQTYLARLRNPTRGPAPQPAAEAAPEPAHPAAAASGDPAAPRP